MAIEQCKQCGGVRNFPIMLLACEGARVVPNNRPVRICSCPPGPKHDGKLGEGTNVYYEPMSGHLDRSVVHIEGVPTHEAIHINPQQALSLLAWLTQEKSTLEQLVKERDA